MMNKRQEATVKSIKAYIEANDLHGADGYEIKTFEVKEMEWGAIQVYSVAGLKNDEGTMAEVFARTRRQIFIGKRGGIRTNNYNSDTKKTVFLSGWADVMIHGASH